MCAKYEAIQDLYSFKVEFLITLSSFKKVEVWNREQQIEIEYYNEQNKTIRPEV